MCLMIFSGWTFTTDRPAECRQFTSHSALKQNPNKKNVSDIPSMVSGSIQWIHRENF